MAWFARCVVPAATAALLLLPSIAAAHDDPGHESSGKPKEEEKKEEEEEADWEALVDFSLGATTTDILNGGKATRNPSLPPINTFDSTRITGGSLLLGIERKLGERLTLGIRLPIYYESLTSRTGAADDRSASGIGNIELEAAYVIARGKTWSIEATLEVALPTAGGSEAPSPDDVKANPTTRYAYNDYDSYAAVHAASAARGSYESALFEPNNLGLVPKISGIFELGKITLRPVVKIENLIDLRKEDDEGYINELVVGLRAGYHLGKVFEPGVNVWFRELREHSRTDTTYSGVGVAEPYARFYFGSWTPAVSLVLPFAGDLVDEKTFGARATLGHEF